MFKLMESDVMEHNGIELMWTLESILDRISNKVISRVSFPQWLTRSSISSLIQALSRCSTQEHKFKFKFKK